MLSPRQIVICGSLAVAFWAVATLCIRLDPASVGNALRGDLGFVVSIPVCWLCVVLTCRLARLEPNQILAGCMIVLGDAMLLDGIALRWFHGVYALDDRIDRLGAAWLLWGYGLTAWITLFIASYRARGSDRGQGMALRPTPAG